MHLIRRDARASYVQGPVVQKAIRKLCGQNYKDVDKDV